MKKRLAGIAPPVIVLFVGACSFFETWQEKLDRGVRESIPSEATCTKTEITVICQYREAGFFYMRINRTVELRLSPSESNRETMRAFLPTFYSIIAKIDFAPADVTKCFAASEGQLENRAGKLRCTRSPSSFGDRFIAQLNEPA
jgi:hypothetical protein